MAIGRKQWINFWRLGSFDDESERARFQTIRLVCRQQQKPITANGAGRDNGLLMRDNKQIRNQPWI